MGEKHRIKWFPTTQALLPGSVLTDDSPPLHPAPAINEYHSSASITTAINEPMKRSLAESIATQLPHNERSRIMRNVFFISIGFTMMMSSFLATANLQSSLFQELGIGTTGLAAYSFGIIISSICLPQLVIGILTVKWTMCVCMLGYAVYTAAQLIPSYYSLVPAGIVMGLGAAPLWIAQSTYLVHVAVLSSEMATTSHGLDTCGFNHCPPKHEPAHDHHYNVTPKELYILATVNLIAILCASVLIAINVDSLFRYGESRWPKAKDLTRVQIKHVLRGVLRHIGHRYSLLLMPLSFWAGLQYGFITAFFTQAFVSCAFGISHVGHVMMTFGVMSAVSSISLSSITEVVGRASIISAGVGINLLVMVTMMLKPLQVAMTVYAMAAGWGFGNAVWKTELNAIYGSVFENTEMAYSSFKLFEAFGFLVSYTIAPRLCSFIIIPIQASFIVCALIPYYIFELMEYKRKSAAELEAINSDISDANPSDDLMTPEHVPKNETDFSISVRNYNPGKSTLSRNTEALPSTINESSLESISTTSTGNRDRSNYNSSYASNTARQSDQSNLSSVSSARSNLSSATPNIIRTSGLSSPSSALNTVRNNAPNNPSRALNADGKSAQSKK